MKTEKEVKKEYDLYSGDKIDKFNYKGPTPLVEYVQQQDRGWKKALEWVLDMEKHETN